MLVAAVVLVVQEMMAVVHLVSNLVVMVHLHSQDRTISLQVAMLPTTEETVAQAVVAVEAPKVVPLVFLLVVIVMQVVELVVDLTIIVLTLLASIISLVVDLQVADNLLQEPMDIFRSLTLTMMEIQTQYLISQQ